MQPQRVEKDIERIKRELTSLGPMRPGALSKQYAACQRPGCACVDPINPKKHGPFFQLSYARAGKSTTRFLRPGYVAQIKTELAAYKRFRDLTQKWVTQELTFPTYDSRRLAGQRTKSNRELDGIT
jgi:hypothetical protein